MWESGELWKNILGNFIANFSGKKVVLPLYNHDRDSEIQKYSFIEKKNTLSARIKTHKKYSKLEINDWILKIIRLQEGDKVLDVGCGTGKQVIPYKKIVGNKGIVIGTDISEELLDEAKNNAKVANLEIKFIKHDANIPFDLPDDYFDVVSCCFAIYYLKNIGDVLLELKRLLRPGGRIFLAGPTPDNAKLLHDLHMKVTQKPLPYMPGISRFMSEILFLIRKYFKKIKIYHFQNPLIFQKVESFIEYYTSTGLFLNSIIDNDEKRKVKEKMRGEVQRLIKEKVEIEILKEVGGILAYK